MAKIKLKAKWDNCSDCIELFGLPVCTYGVLPKEGISLKDLFSCMKNGICRKEEIEKNRR